MSVYTQSYTCEYIFTYITTYIHLYIYGYIREYIHISIGTEETGVIERIKDANLWELSPFGSELRSRLRSYR